MGLRGKLVTVVLGIAALAAALPDTPLRAAPLRPVVLELQPYVGRLRTVEVRVGDATHDFLFDTGGGLTLLTPEVTASLGREPWGRLVAFRANGDRIDVARLDPLPLDLEGRFEVRPEAAVFDLAALLPEGLPPLGGLLSLQTFADHAVTLDLSTNRLIIESETSLRDRVLGVPRMEMRVNHQTGGASLDVFFAVAAPEGRRLWIEMDSANLGEFILAPHAAKLLGMEPQVVDGREVWPESFPMTLAVPGVGPVRTLCKVEEIIYDGLCSEAFLSGLMVTLDLRENLMWARPVGP